MKLFYNTKVFNICLIYKYIFFIKVNLLNFKNRKNNLYLPPPPAIVVIIIINNKIIIVIFLEIQFKD